MRNWLERLIDYFLFVELFSFKQDQFSINHRNRLSREDLRELYITSEIRKAIGKSIDGYDGLFFKVHLGTLQLGTLVDYALDKFNQAGLFIARENELEQIEELKRDKTYISLGYFYLNPKGQFVAKNKNAYFRVLPFVFLLTLLESGKRELKDLISSFHDNFEKVSSDFSKIITEEYKRKDESLTESSLLEEYILSGRQEKSLPSLCFILDSSAILDKAFKAEDLKDLKNCIICVTPQILREIDLKKKVYGYIGNRARKFRRVFDEMVTQAKESQPDSSLAQGLWYPSIQSEQRILIISPSFNIDQINPSNFGVDSEGDLSVIKAALEFSKRSFPIIVATDKAFKWSTLQRTPFVGFSRDINLDIILSDTKLLEHIERAQNRYCLSFNSLVDIERNFFRFFKLDGLYSRLSSFRGEDFIRRFGFVTVELVPRGITEIAKALNEDNYIIKDLTIFRKKFLEAKKNNSVRFTDNNVQNKHKPANNVSNSIRSFKKGPTKVSDNTENLVEENFPELVKSVLGGRVKPQDVSKLNLSDLRDVLKCLFTQKIPVGRYASPHLPTLLQQIAINQALELQEGQVLAVNGPPGTGKTTLLKEIIANIVIKRAIEIAKLKGEIFTNEGVLNDKVTRFKIVVVSNNNTAVENITLELPKLEGVKEALLMCGNEYTDFRYFGTIAKEYFKIKAKEDKEEIELEDSKLNKQAQDNSPDLFKEEELSSFDSDGKDTDKSDKKNEEFFGLLALPLGKFENREKAANCLSILVESLLEGIDKKFAKQKEDQIENEIPDNFDVPSVNKLNENKDIVEETSYLNNPLVKDKDSLDSRSIALDTEFQSLNEQELERRIEELCNEVIQLAEEIIKETERVAQFMEKRTEMVNRLKDLSKSKKELEDSLNNLKNDLNSLDTEEDTLSKELVDARKLYETLTAELSRLESIKPAFTDKLKAIFNTKLKDQIKEHKKLCNTKRDQLKDCEFYIKEKETKLRLLKKEKELLLQKTDSVLKNYNEIEEAYNDLENRLCNKESGIDLSARPFGKLEYVNLLDIFIFLEKDILTEEQKKELFKSAPYDFRDEDLSIKRITLFLKALELHKLMIFKHRDRFSFLLKKFIKILRSYRVEVKNENIPLESLWDTFFFIVPVTSTTLASFSRMFAPVRDEFIDYLLVDEAGQAQIHSFIMPLVKSRRLIVVGDPFQIEPVYNLISGLDNMLCDFFHIPTNYAVTENSVQTYADVASILGGIYEVGEKNVRVGVPLNVHRRCNSPMFDIANKIAYSNYMIKGKEDSFHVHNLMPEHLRMSKWFHVDFEPNNDGVVEGEINLLKNLLLDIEQSLVTKNVNVKDFIKKGNIFVITPFRAVRDRLKEEKGDMIRYLVSEGNFIGTVHTFQGREANIVFIVLGGRNERSMAWASSKPNLLNVALTRAKELCFIIGDRNLWGKMPYFKEAVKIMQVEHLT